MDNQINTDRDHIIVRKDKGADCWVIENYGLTNGSPSLVIHGDIGDAIAEGQADAEANPTSEVYLVELRFVHLFRTKN